MIRGLASLAGLVVLFLILATFGARFAEPGVVKLIMPSPQKPDLQAEYDAASAARWDAERAMAELTAHDGA